MGRGQSGPVGGSRGANGQSDPAGGESASRPCVSFGGLMINNYISNLLLIIL
jgi:hypothetical protein